MEIPIKAIRSQFLANKYAASTLKESLADYHFFADTIMYLHQAVSENETTVHYWQRFGETLFHKFLFHCLAIHKLLSGYELSSVYYRNEVHVKQYIDISSAKIIFRAQLEALLMYHHIYINPTDDDERELRYNAWMYSSLLQRQEMPAETDYGKRRKGEDLVGIEEMKEVISNLSAFKRMNDKQQKGLIEKGTGKLFKHWATILKETGFSELNPFYTIYTHLSMYSHSEGVSILQMANPYKRPMETWKEGKIDLHNSKLLICMFISSLLKIFPLIEQRFKALPIETQYDIEIYTTLALSEQKKWDKPESFA